MTKITREELDDTGIVDAAELSARGAPGSAFRSGTSVISTTADTKTVVVSSGLRYGNLDPVEVGDITIISGNDAAGTYTVQSVTSDTTFVVVEAIPSSTGGSVAFKHPAGAVRVGVDSTGLLNTSASNAQQALADLDSAIVTEADHENLDTLVHALSETSYTEVTRDGNGRVTDVIVWTSPAKTTKIRETTLTRTSDRVSQVVSKQYNGSGALLQTLTEGITRDGQGRYASTTTTEA